MKAPKIGFLTLVLFSFAAVLTAPAEAQSIGSTNWTGTTFSGVDPFYGTFATVEAFRTGSTATLVLTFSNSFSEVNVTAVKVLMDWGTNYTSTEASSTNPANMDAFTSRTFSVSFPVPATSTATNLVTHTYTIFVEFKTSPTGPTSTATGGGSGFAVYSTDQADTILLMNGLGLSPSFTGFGITVCQNFIALEGSEARSACLRAQKEALQGIQLYQSGDFAGAKTRLQSANTLYDQAVSLESSRGSSAAFEATLQSWGSLLLGIGGVVGGVAAVVYALRRPREMRTSATAT